MPIEVSQSINATCKVICPFRLHCGDSLIRNNDICFIESRRIRDTLETETGNHIYIYVDGKEVGDRIKFCRPNKGIIRPSGYDDCFPLAVLVRGDIYVRTPSTPQLIYPDMIDSL